MPEQKANIQEQLRSLEDFKANMGQAISSQELAAINKIKELLKAHSSSATPDIAVPPQEVKKS